MIVLQQLINGLQVGSIYALIALGYSMVYGIIMLLNFAHGDIIMVGSYIALLIISAGIHPLLAVLAAVVGCMALACLIEKAAYTPLRQAPRISLLITAIGVSYFLENMAQLIMGANPMAFPNTAVIPSKTYNVGAVIAMSLLTLLVQKTRSGKAMRAVSEDMGAAQLLIAVMIFKPSGLLGRRDFSMTALIERLMNPGLRKAEKEAERHD